MEDETKLFRVHPPRPYVRPHATLSLPANALEATVEYLRRAGPLESCVFWYGHRTGLNGNVMGVLAPRQRMARGNYHVDASAVSEMVDGVPEDWKPLAQVHSHPGAGVEHSTYDDRMMSSRRALSVVFPFYGHWSAQWPLGVGVHEYQADYWHLLTCDDAQARVVVTASTSVLMEDYRI